MPISKLLSYIMILTTVSLATLAVSAEPNKTQPQAEENVAQPIIHNLEIINQPDFSNLNNNPAPVYPPAHPGEKTMMEQLTGFIDSIKTGIQSIFNIDLGPKIIAIIAAIQAQCDKLINLISGPNPMDAKKLNEIQTNIDAQRKTLSTVISNQPGNDSNTTELNSYLSKIDATAAPKSDSTLKVYSH